MAKNGKVLRMHRRDKKSVREVVKATSLARNTVRKYPGADRVEEPRRSRREQAPSNLASFVEAIEQALIADARRPKLQVGLGPELMLGEGLPTLVDRAETGNGEGRDAEHPGSRWSRRNSSRIAVTSAELSSKNCSRSNSLSREGNPHGCWVSNESAPICTKSTTTPAWPSTRRIPPQPSITRPLHCWSRRHKESRLISPD